jgi:hypothetical protein
MKEKKGYSYAKQIWKMCNGRVHHYLMQFEWNDRNKCEVDCLTRVFDRRMKHGALLYDKDIRIIACRIFVLQTHELTGSWETATQFQEKPLGFAVLDEKQLSRAAKSAKQLQQMAPGYTRSVSDVSEDIESQSDSSANPNQNGIDFDEPESNLSDHDHDDQ